MSSQRPLWCKALLGWQLGDLGPVAQYCDKPAPRLTGYGPACDQHWKQWAKQRLDTDLDNKGAGGNDVSDRGTNATG